MHVVRSFDEQYENIILVEDETWCSKDEVLKKNVEDTLWWTCEKGWIIKDKGNLADT